MGSAKVRELTGDLQVRQALQLQLDLDEFADKIPGQLLLRSLPRIS
jgi:hypothetical protein